MARYASEELKATRREEIINACEKLYQTLSFKEITMKEISVETSFTRPSIYNYFQTKEEIFLGLFSREYDKWVADIEKIYEENSGLTPDEFADKLSRSIEKRGLLLKLLSMNMYDMEENSSEKALAVFKKSYGHSLRAVEECLDVLSPPLSDKEKQSFLYSFFPFMYGIYPYTSVTEKQKKAMEKAEVGFIYNTVYDLAYETIKKLLNK